jgi:hypothetical protein
LTELLNPLTPIEDRRVGAVSLDEVGLDLVSAPSTSVDQPNTRSRRFPSVIGGPGSDLIAAQMEPVRANRTEKRDIPTGCGR